MIIGIGTDIIKISRIEKAKRELGDMFLDKIFTEKEKAYCEEHKSASCYAARFAAKEAVAKALGLGFEKELSWKNVEIINNQKGKPFVSFSGKITDKTKNYSCHISLSHCTDYATATSIIELKCF